MAVQNNFNSICFHISAVCTCLEELCIANKRNSTSVDSISSFLSQKNHFTKPAEKWKGGTRKENTFIILIFMKNFKCNFLRQYSYLGTCYLLLNPWCTFTVILTDTNKSNIRTEKKTELALLCSKYTNHINSQ